MTPPLPHVSLPPATAEYQNILQPTQAGAAPLQSASKMFRSADGKTRIDTGNSSVITDPAAGKTILLNHLKQQAHVMPTPPAVPPLPGQPPPPPGMPGFHLPALPSMPSMSVKDLGKSVMNGHEVVGQQFTHPTPPALGMPGAPAIPGVPAMPKIPGMPAMPKIPGMPAAPALAGMPAAPKIPGMPAAPAIPGAPSAPAPPGMPAAPHPPTVTEVWTSTKMHLPMLTKATGPFANFSSTCKSAIPGEPHPSVFQIPAGYKLV